MDGTAHVAESSSGRSMVVKYGTWSPDTTIQVGRGVSRGEASLITASSPTTILQRSFR